MLWNEYQVLKKTDHPHIVKIYEVWEDDDYYFIVTELLKGGEVYERLLEEERFNEQFCADITKQVLLALNHCHSQNIIHRDLKPENVLFEAKNSTNVRLVDFGFAKFFNPKKGLNEVLGTPLFIAPEILERKTYHLSADVWSLGVIVYNMICGSEPFSGKDRNDLFSNIKKAEYSFFDTIWESVSENCKDFINQCLKKNPKERSTAAELLDHPWIKEVVPDVEISDE